LGNKSKTLHFCIFGCGAYVFLPSEVHANKLVPHSELMIFIGYKDNGYHFICHTQGNIIFHSTHAIFNEELFLKCTDSHTKECQLYDKLLDKISPEIELSVPDPSGKARPVPVPTPHTHLFLLFKTILLLVLLYLFFLISLYLLYLPQGLKSLQ